MTSRFTNTLTRRVLSREHMDDLSIDRRELAEALRFIRLVNHRLGGTRAALRCIQRWSAHRPGDQTIRILDVGTGSADIPLAIAQWAERTGRRVHITAIDRHPLTLELAREHIGNRDDIELIELDALKLTQRFRARDFDYVHAGMFLHHLSDIEVITLLSGMDKLAARGVIWNDLTRGPLEKLAVRLLALGLPGVPAYVRHDAIVSVAAGFTRREALDLARRAGLTRPTFQRRLLGGRFLLTSEKM